MSFDRELLDILACPQCQRDLTLTPEEDGLVCEACKVKYPIRDGVPVMLADEAEPVAD
ncbi:MAG: Trm112 family protein [Nitrospinae bacterium]|nr:Trm112 family protein [Nitrospinota bacterium]